MKNLLLLLLITVGSYSYAQSDTTKAETYDVVYLTEGYSVRGKIMSFDPSDGDIVFVGLDGKKYFFGKEDYTSFEENLEFKKKKRKKSDDAEFVLNERKETEFEVSLGFTTPFTTIIGDRQSDGSLYLDYYRSYNPLCLNAGFGKYFSRHHFAGLNVEFGLNTALKTFASVNLRYSHQYDANKKNVALYIPIDLQYNYLKGNMPFDMDLTDTTFSEDGVGYSTSYPTTTNIDVAYTSAGISVGHGVAFILNKKNSIALELAYFRLFVLSKSYTNIEGVEPELDFKQSGLKFSLKYNF